MVSLRVLHCQVGQECEVVDAMVHFGQYLKAAQTECFGSYVDYKSLKKLVKACATCQEPACEQFAVEQGHTLDGDANAPPSIFDGSQHSNQFITLLNKELHKLNHCVMQAKSGIQAQEYLEELAIFAETNRVAFHKIVKKFEKKCGPKGALQPFLQGLPEQPFLTTLSEELPKARTAVQTSLLLAGVCQQSVEEEALVIDHDGDQVHSLSGSVRLQVDDQQVHPTSANSGSSLAWSLLRATAQRARLVLRCALLLFSARWLRAARVLMSLGCLCILFAAALQFSPIVAGPITATISGIGLLLVIMAVINAGMSFISIETTSPKYCIWQQLRFAELSSKSSCRVFAVMKIHSTETGTSAEHVAEHAACSRGDMFGNVCSSNMSQTECGCCFNDFEGQDVVALLPCQHVFHEKCILSWASSAAKGSQQCPMCRASYKFDFN